MTTITIAQWQSDEKSLYSPSGARNRLGDRGRDRLCRDRKALGIPLNRPLNQDEIQEIQRMRRFLALAPGVHSRELYAKLRTQPVLLKHVFKKYGVEP